MVLAVVAVEGAAAAVAAAADGRLANGLVKIADAAFGVGLREDALARRAATAALVRPLLRRLRRRA